MKRLALLALSMIFVLSVAVPSAFALSAGTYNLLIMPTITKTVGTTTVVQTKWKSAGIYSSSFSFNALPGKTSQTMTDLDGSGDGYAGVVGISVDALGVVTTTSFQKDDILGTAGGTFFQNAGIGISGNGSSTAGTDVGSTLDWNSTNRLGSINGVPGMINLPWNIDDATVTGVDTNGNPIFVNNGNTVWGNTSTAGATNLVGTVVGTPVYTDSNGDLRASIIAGGTVGSAWGGFWGAQYFEVWDVKIIPTVVPEPGSLLLIGSGLVGLIGLARKRSKK